MVKVTLKGLYDDPNVGDGYLLWQGFFPGYAWSIAPEISDDLISARGTYSTAFTLTKDDLNDYPIWLQYLDKVDPQGLKRIVDFGFTPPQVAPNFKAANRCF